MFPNQWICSVNVDVSVFLSQRSRPCALCWMPSAWSTGRTCLSTRSVPLNQSSTSGLTLCYFFSSPVGPVLSPKYFSAFRPRYSKKVPNITSQYKLPSINFPLYCESFVKIVVTQLSLTFFHLVCWKQKSTHRCSYNNCVVEEKSDFLVIELLSNRTSQGNNFVMFVPDGGAYKSQCSLWGWSQRFLSCLLTQFPVHFTVKHSQLTYCVVFN